MALTGKWVEYKEMESSAGKPFIIATLEYNGKPWENLSTFDGNIIEVARGLSKGADVEFETKKSGKYTNLISLNGSKGGAQGQAVKGKTVGNRDFAKEGYEKAMCGLMNSFVHGYSAHHGDGPDGKKMTMMGHRFHIWVKKLQANEFVGGEEEKDGTIPF